MSKVSKNHEKPLNPSLGDRLKKLPADLDVKPVLQEAGMTHARYYRMMANEDMKIYAHEAQALCNLIGCTVNQLMDPEVSLLAIYVQNQNESESLRSRVGLEPPKQVA